MNIHLLCLAGLVVTGCASGRSGDELTQLDSSNRQYHLITSIDQERKQAGVGLFEGADNTLIFADVETGRWRIIDCGQGLMSEYNLVRINGTLSLQLRTCIGLHDDEVRGLPPRQQAVAYIAELNRRYGTYVHRSLHFQMAFILSDDGTLSATASGSPQGNLTDAFVEVMERIEKEVRWRRFHFDVGTFHQPDLQRLPDGTYTITHHFGKVRPEQQRGAR